MFDEILREIEQMQKSFTLSIDLPVDDKGYFDRQCPHRDCKSAFKIFDPHWEEKIANDRAYCPKCGVSESTDEFNTPAQQKYIEDVGEAYVAKQFNDAMARAANRTPPKTISGGLIDIKTSISFQADPVVTPAPSQAREVLRQEFVCGECECKYSAVGAAYFCPACGHNSAISDFDQTVQTTLKAVELMDQIKSTVAENADEDTAANIEEQMAEDQIENLVTALQRVTEALYEKIPGAATPPFNVFQRIDDASQLWLQATASSYSDVLSEKELSFLKVMIQRRHKLGHAQGIVDDRYINRSGDASYAAGQRLVVKRRDVIEMAEIVRKLVAGLS